MCVRDRIVVQFCYFADFGSAKRGARILEDVDQKFLGVFCIQIVIVIASDQIAGYIAAGFQYSGFFGFLVAGNQDGIDPVHLMDCQANVVYICMYIGTDQ